MMWHNMRRAPLSDLKVRKAVDLVLDRSALTQTLLGGDPTRSLFPDNTPWARPETDTQPDKDEAEKLLDASGWKLDNSDNKRKIGAIPLKLTVIAYPFRPGLGLMLPEVAKALESLGITVDARNVPLWDGSNTILADKDYDLLMWAQNTLPAGDPQWFLNAFFRSDGGSNHAGLNSTDIDRKLNALAETESHNERVTTALTAHNAIIAQVPVSNLMTPHWHVGLSSRLSDYKPWGSDYYVVRPDTEPNLCVSSDATSTSEPTDVSRAPEGSFGSCWAMLAALAVLRLATM
jgi:peptide/nickel transport system substrate-binding protein